MLGFVVPKKTPSCNYAAVQVMHAYVFNSLIHSEPTRNICMKGIKIKIEFVQASPILKIPIKPHNFAIVRFSGNEHSFYTQSYTQNAVMRTLNMGQQMT